MPQTRQLAAIMFTDIVGYTALMGEDEQKAFQILQKNRELQKPIIETYNGRWIKELGDGIMASFTTVSEAVNAAKEIQKQCLKSGEFSLRIGIHVGEIVFEGEDVFGDAVNIAARIQAIAPVGGIFVSEAVHYAVANKPDIKSSFVKTEILKNVKEPANIYEIIFDQLKLPTTGRNPTNKKITTVIKKKITVPVVASIIGALVLLIAVVVFFNKEKNGITPDVQTLAVLPFINESGNADLEYLSDGMTETLISNLSQLPKVKVKARTSVFRYKGKAINVQQIGKELIVKSILSGRVLQRGQDLLVSLWLVDTNTEENVWSKQYNKKMTDLITLQSEIAKDVAENLKIELSGTDENQLNKQQTSDVEAFQLDLKGRFFWNKRTEEGLRKGVEYFEQAIAKDPGYPLAYVGLADSYNIIGFYNFLPPKEAFPKAKAAARQALVLDEKLSEAHNSLAYVLLYYDWDFAAAEEEFKRAIELNPRYAVAHQWYANLLTAMGRWDEAIQQFKRSQELDVLSPVITAVPAWTYYYARQYDRAIQPCLKAIEMDANLALAYNWLGQAYERKGMYEKAIAQFKEGLRISPDDFNLKALLAHVYAASGNKREAQVNLNDLLESGSKRYVSPYHLATIYTSLGDKDNAIKWLETSLHNRQHILIFLKYDSRMDDLRSDPRFTFLLQRISRLRDK
jgi:TolB-like protein/class 3 adenylate cyclase/Flp pilus assembly protein TadD